mmetsp:Transcript_9523/g.17962  ORF Transcript_9523/g.17962 Transcript_9523/m.17962 type:complete len:123 (+) Transcript_9523:65-433(+)
MRFVCQSLSRRVQQLSQVLEGMYSREECLCIVFLRFSFLANFFCKFFSFYLFASEICCASLVVKRANPLRTAHASLRFLHGCTCRPSGKFLTKKTPHSQHRIDKHAEERGYSVRRVLADLET